MRALWGRAGARGRWMAKPCVLYPWPLVSPACSLAELRLQAPQAAEHAAERAAVLRPSALRPRPGASTLQMQERKYKNMLRTHRSQRIENARKVRVGCTFWAAARGSQRSS